MPAVLIRATPRFCPLPPSSYVHHILSRRLRTRPPSRRHSINIIIYPLRRHSVVIWLIYALDYRPPINLVATRDSRVTLPIAMRRADHINPTHIIPINTHYRRCGCLYANLFTPRYKTRGCFRSSSRSRHASPHASAHQVSHQIAMLIVEPQGVCWGLESRQEHVYHFVSGGVEIQGVCWVVNLATVSRTCRSALIIYSTLVVVLLPCP